MGKLLLVLATSLTQAEASAPAKSVAMVISLQGPVEVVRKSQDGDAAAPKRAPARILLRLFEGDQIVTKDKATATLVFFQDEFRVMVRPSKTVTIGRQGCQPADAVEHTELPESVLARSIGGIDPLSPRASGFTARNAQDAIRFPPGKPMQGSMVRTGRPAFSWAAVSGARSYQVQLLSSANRPVWRETTESASLNYPAGQAPLKDGSTYHWRVTAFDCDGKELARLPESEFFVADGLDREDLKTIDALAKNIDVADRLLAAAGYEERRLFDEALQVFESLSRQFPGEAAFHHMRAHYYRQGGRPDEAQKAAKQAIALLMADDSGQLEALQEFLEPPDTEKTPFISPAVAEPPSR